MSFTWNQIGIKEITQLYLYGDTITPSDFLNYTWVREPTEIISIQIDAPSYMETGPGRFATANLSSLVSGFMSGERKVAIPGKRQEFSIADMLLPMEENKFSIQQYEFDDNNGDGGDHALRSYIWGSCSFTIAPSSRFVIEADGTRHILDYAVLPYHDNFDFESGNSFT